MDSPQNIAILYPYDHRVHSVHPRVPASTHPYRATRRDGTPHAFTPRVCDLKVRWCDHYKRICNSRAQESVLPRTGRPRSRCASKRAVCAHALRGRNHAACQDSVCAREYRTAASRAQCTPRRAHRLPLLRLPPEHPRTPRDIRVRALRRTWNIRVASQLCHTPRPILHDMPYGGALLLFPPPNARPAD